MSPVPLPPSDPERAASTKRDEILRAALELFSERSFEGTPVPLVAQRARSGAGTIYRHFESKQALANAVYLSCRREMGRALDRAAPSGASVREEFASLWSRLWHFAIRHREGFRFLELHHHASYLDERSRAASDEVFARLEDFIRRGQVRGEIARVPPPVLIAMLLGAFVGLVKEADQGRLKLDDATREASEGSAWSLLAAKPAGTDVG
jgi:AcrR family transcriptional regulator